MRPRHRFLQILAMNYPRLRWFSTAILVLSFAASNQLSAGQTPGVVVVGFVGGFVHHNDAAHQEVQLADRLRKDYSSGVDVKIFANHFAAQAHQQILQSLDADHDGTLSAQEKHDARIVLYGHSWGASEAVTMARKLEKDGVPVLLTIQVDSVSKPGEEDGFIPANVAQAINFYQLDGLLHGRRQILAADPSKTQILGNFRENYTSRRIDTAGYPWYARLFMRPHIEIESDPGVWGRVESLIRSKL